MKIKKRIGETSSPAASEGEEYRERSLWRILGPALENLDGQRNRTLSAYEHGRKAASMAGVCIWDVLSEVHTKVGRRRKRGKLSGHSSDRSPPTNDISGLLQAHPTIATIAFNGAKAMTAYVHAFGDGSKEGYKGAKFRHPPHVKLIKLPSSSTAAAIPMDAKIKAWSAAFV